MNSQDTSPLFSRNPSPPVDHPLSFNGRFGRLSFIGWYAFLNIMSVFASIALSLVSGIFNLSTLSLDNPFANIFTSIAGLGYVVLMMFYLYFYIVITARRLHDLNQSGWFMLLMLLPVINLVFILYLLFASGTKGPNTYGVPRPSAIWEKLLAWLIIIISLLSIFATGTLVSYMMGSTELETPQEVIQKGIEYF